VFGKLSDAFSNERCGGGFWRLRDPDMGWHIQHGWPVS
jgi:hypothetical protein